MSIAINQLIWLGAGSATEPAGLIANANQVVLVEARKAACQQLSAQFSASAKVSVKQALLSRDGDEVNFTEYNLAEFSALSPLAGLSELFPGLTAVRSRPQPSLTLSQLLTPLALSGNNNTLVLDIADLSLAFLQQLQASGQLEKFNQLYLQGSKLALYQGAPTQAQLISYLEQQGFMLQAQDNTDPDLPWLQFGLNPLWQPLQQSRTEQQQAQQQSAELTKQLNAVKQQAVENNAQQQQQLLEQKRQFEQKLAQLTQQLAQRVSENETLQQQQAAAKVAAEKSQAELQGRLAGMDAELQQALKQRQTAEQQIHSLNETLEQQAQTLADVQQQLAKVQSWLENRKKQVEGLEHELSLKSAENELLKSQQVTKGAMTELQANIEGMFKQQALQLQQAVNALGQHVSKTQHEQEHNLQNVLALQQFVQWGAQPLTLSAWSVQADTLNCLIKQLSNETYDLVIEFGSGDSTVVLAKALQQKNSVLQGMAADNKLDYEKNNRTEQSLPQHYVWDLPARIVSFEQNEQYLHKTKQALGQHGLAGLVELVLAPLVPTEYKAIEDNTKLQLFYDCQLKLQKLAGIVAERQVNILVIVDGPFSPEQDELVRYPALPVLLNAFSAHKLHIVLDDSKRRGEQQVVAKWGDLLEQRGLSHSVKNWPTAKGAVLIEVSP